jgi:outer membrane cobalamin receptor
MLKRTMRPSACAHIPALLCVPGLLLPPHELIAQAAASLVTNQETVHVIAEPVSPETLAGTHTYLNQSAIASTGARDTSELLRMLGVVHLSQAGSKGALSAVTLRGAKPNFTLVLIDGVPVNDIGDLLGGAFNFATVSTDDIESIDILRGPLSSIYGSEAIGGVITIHLRKTATEPAYRVSTEAGNYGHVATSSGAGFVKPHAAAFSEGSFSRFGTQVLNDGSMLGTAGVHSDFDLGVSRNLTSSLRWDRLSATGFPVSSGGPLFALSRKIETDQADQLSGATSFQQQVNAKWFYTAGYDVFSRVAMNDTPPIFDTIPPGQSYVPSAHGDARFLRHQILTVQQLEVAKWLMLDAVASYRHEAGTSAGTLAGVLPASYALARPTEFFSTNATLNKAGLALTAGTGVETSNTYHAVVLPRVGMSYSRGETRLRGSWGEGYKLPSFYSLGNPLVGNPKLTPEFGKGFDAAIERHFAKPHAQFGLTYFDNTYRDLIDFSPSIFKLVNRNSAFSRGLELEGKISLHIVEVGGSVSYDDAGLRDTSERLRDVPRWGEDLHLTLPIRQALQLNLATAWVGRRYDYQVPVPQDSTVAKYSITNLNLTYRLRESLQGYVRIENLFDRKYQEFVGFPSPGSYVSAGLRFVAGSRGTKVP